MLQENIVEKTLTVNFVTRQGGAYGYDPEDLNFKAYIPKWVVRQEKLQVNDTLHCNVGPNYPQMINVCPNMVKSLVDDKPKHNWRRIELNEMDIVELTPEVPVAKPLANVVEITNKSPMKVIEVQDTSTSTSTDLAPFNLTDMTVKDLDELILTAFEELPRLTYAEVFWIISGYPKMKLREMSLVQRSGYDRVSVRCAQLHKKGALACAEFRKSENASISKRVYALKLDDL